MKKFFILGITTFLIVPQIAFAAWWNPFTWNWKALFQTQIEVGKTENPVPLEEAIVEPTEEQTWPVGNEKLIAPTSPRAPQEIPAVIPEPQPAKVESLISENAPGQTDNNQKVSDLVRKMNNLTEAYNKDIQNIDKEILSLEKGFYEYKEAVYKTPTSARIMESRIAQKLDETNDAIAKLNIGKQEKYYDYSNAYDKLNRELVKLQTSSY